MLDVNEVMNEAGAVLEIAEKMNLPAEVVAKLLHCGIPTDEIGQLASVAEASKLPLDLVARCVSVRLRPAGGAPGQPGPTGPQGPKGDKGDPGDPGGLVPQ